MAKKTANKKVMAKAPGVKAAKKATKVAVKKASPTKTPKKGVKSAPKAEAKAKKEAKPSTLKATTKTVTTKKTTTPLSTSVVEIPVVAPKVSPVEKLAADEAEFSMPATKPPKVKKKSKRQLAAEEELDQMGKKWAALLKKTEKMDIKPSPYNMRKSYDARTPIEHKILGWGYILANKNDRLEVLFKDGIKFLISNYKG